MAKQVKDFSYDVSLFFLLCKGVPNVDSVKPLAHLLAQEGFHPSPAKGGEELYVVSDINALVEARFQDWEATGKVFGGLLREVAFPLLMEEFPADKIKCYFAWNVHKGERVSITLGGQVWASREEQKTHQEPFAQRLLMIALKLYPLVQPVYGYMGDPDVDSHPWKVDGIVRREIVTLNWVNFFGPEYVEKYGREMLAGIPGWRTQDLPDGGLLYQSRPSIVVEDEEAHKRWQRQAIEYLASYGIRIGFDFP